MTSTFDGRALRADTSARSPHARRAALASFVGSTLEYYDFFIYASFSALAFNTLFFPDLGSFWGTIVSMATIGIGYVVRPLAALVFGHFGDTLGRKRMLVVTLVMMGVATSLIGCLPTYGAIGVAAPILLVLLRAVQGASAAGESAGAASLALEHAPAGRRALAASWVNTGAAAGMLLASLVVLVFSGLPEDAFLDWGWRIPFLLSMFVALAGLVIRRMLPESEVFEEAVVADGPKEMPAKVIFRDHWPSVLRVVGCGLFAVVSTIFSAFALSWGTHEAGVSRTVMVGATVLTAALALVAQPAAGILADRIGRKPVFITGNLVCAVSVSGFFWAISQRSTALILITACIVMVVGYSLVNAIGPALYAEMFETRIRYSGMAISGQLALVATGFAPTIAAALVRPGPNGWIPVAAFTAGCCLFSALTTLTVRETYRTSTTDLGK
ncbi:MHS family MFS transporter [Rhodococcus pseudokoreensis]|uniref:MHS family MFS transporter n=1 Tax=Rhodococcus pseudokoreensis TaxID=2811421 RepID=A0A974ZTP4_9NOCA|nr:MFS transporter [Rhodococcus pseudokoreensis]QSE90085.1 MHS family MFS transporter [Rhodococcus pseudokoreensis]